MYNILQKQECVFGTGMYSQYLWRCSSSTHQQAMVCCHCWKAAGSVSSVVMAWAAVAGSLWSTGTGKDIPWVYSASSGPAEDCCRAGHGWRSSSQLWAKGALSTEQAEAWWNWEAIRWTLPAVNVSGAGVVPLHHLGDAWWCSLCHPGQLSSLFYWPCNTDNHIEKCECVTSLELFQRSIMKSNWTYSHEYIKRQTFLVFILRNSWEFNENNWV